MPISYDTAIGVLIVTLSVCSGIIIAGRLKSATQEIIAPFIVLIIGIIIAALLVISHGMLWVPLGW